ncbi:DUF397 domain-containing protein [Streptomyces albireticuli]|uniref:DUF397 domain-containing protein n=1 Tax=Streptomyces albireticuli TaxID=1940 RepID=UPI000B45060F|nr:DUF397 domain-containing protein [Streptomyces albireticuli]
MAECGWQRSTFSGGGGNNCVEIAAAGSGIVIRESEAPDQNITTDRGMLSTLLIGIKAGRFRGPAT